MTEHTDLGTQRTNVTETAESVGSDEARTWAKIVVRRLGVWVDERLESNKLVGNDLDTNETSHKKQIVALARYTEKEGDWVQKVTKDQLERQVVVAVEVDVAPPPGEETIHQVEKRNNTQKGRDDHTGDLQTEPGTVGECMEGVSGLVLIVVGYNNTTGGKSLLGLWVSQLTEGERRGNAHDAR